MYLTENEKKIKNCVSQAADLQYIMHARQLGE